MNKKARTKEERYMLALYEETLRQEDEEAEIDRVLIGDIIGINPPSVENICKGLMRSNFIRFHEAGRISLTSQGRRLVFLLLEEK